MFAGRRGVITKPLCRDEIKELRCARPSNCCIAERAVRPRYALLPLEGFPPSKLPAWPGSEARVLAAPALGAEFVQYLLNVPTGRGTEHAADSQIETFFYVLSGEVRLSDWLIRGEVTERRRLRPRSAGCQL